LSAHLQENHGANVTLQRSRGGAFEVTVNGELLFSKLAQGRFPTHDEIDRLLAER
jgi:selT/selW/selH-like putative selenoprotein